MINFLKSKQLFFLLFIILSIIANLKIVFCAYVAIFCAIIYMLLNDDEHNFYFGLFLVPNITLFNVTGITFLVNLLLSFPMFVYCFRNKFNFSLFPFISTILLFLLEIIHVIVLENFSNIASVISCFFSMFYCISITLDNKISFNYKNVADYLSFGVVCSAIIYLFCNSKFSISIIVSVISGDRFTAYAGDPNYYSLYICVAIAMIFMLNNHSFLEYTFLGMLTIIGLLTASKMCFIILITVFLFGLGYNLFKIYNKKRFRFLLSVLCVVVLGVVLFSEELLILFNNFLYRSGVLNNGSFDSFTTGRYSLWLHYLDVLNNNLLCFILGYGFQYHLFLGDYTGRGAHNTYLDIILAWGIIGVVFIIVLLLIWILKLKSINNNIKNKFVHYLPLSVLIVTFFSLSCLSATMFWWMLTIVLLPVYHKEKSCIF